MTPTSTGGKAAGATRNDAAARERIRHSLEESLIVEASAGTGKTTELVNRIVQVLGRGFTTIEKVVAVTFTHKAAGELKIRLRQKLDEERARSKDAEVAARLETALEELEEASIGTIHGFCAQILRSRPVEARIDPAFEELTEPEAARIYARAFHSWFQRQLDEDSPGLRRALARLAWREDWESGPALDQLKKAGRNLVEWRDFTALWQPEPFDRDAAVKHLLEQARALWRMAAACTRSTDTLLGSLRPLRDVLAWMDRGRVTDPDTLEAVLLKLGRDLKRGGFRKGSGFFAREYPRETVVAEYEALQNALEQFRRESGVLLACQLQHEMRSLVETYTDLKTRTGKLDFVDLLLLARNLVRDNETVRRYLQERFTHVFVDEFQDTDPLQAEILLLLSADSPGENDWRSVAPSAGKLFLVGDPKQSIYKFRRADVSLYLRVADQLENRGVGRVYLTQSYRSVRAVKQFVNAAFETEMTGDEAAAQAGYSPLEEDGGEIPGQPAIIALPAPKPYGSRDVAKYAIDACLPATVAAFVEWLVNKSGWQVRENGALTRVKARHVCILFRRFINFQMDLTREYVRALEARNVPHLLVGSKSFHDREEVETIRTALTAIEWPEDELSVYATLRGSLFAIADGVLFRFRQEHGKLHSFRKYPAELMNDFQPVTAALAVLAELHRARNRRPVSDTVRALLDKARAHAGFAMRPGGQQVLANVYRICDLARQYELTGGFSFRGFVEELNAQAEKTEAPEAPVLEEAADGVRLMTVHNAKGLEFPVVILADMTANLCSKEPDRFIDAERRLCATRLLRCAPKELLDNEPQELLRERAEGVRVCYVAATRARDLLVVSAVGDEARSGWLEPLNKALYPPKNRWRAAAGCEWFTGDCTVLDRPYPTQGETDPSIKPGVHSAETGKHQVVWWDPAMLDLNVAENFGLRQINVLKAEGASERSLKEYEEWRGRRTAVIANGAAASVSVVRVTELIEEPPLAPVALEEAIRGGGRSRGKRFGTLVHAILRDAAWDASTEDVERLAALHRVAGGASEEEQRDAATAAASVLAHPLLLRAARAARCHRELPITLPFSSGRVLEGVIDLAFVEDGQWQVVDFKTDGDVEANREEYERQLRWYLHALASVTGMRAVGTLLAV
jgi:ATP-dependent exoDNAse (exonuclease V) beta subunit